MAKRRSANGRMAKSWRVVRIREFSCPGSVALDRMRRFRSPAFSQAPEDRRLLRLVPNTGHSRAPARGFGGGRRDGARCPLQSGARRRSPRRCRDNGRAVHSTDAVEARFVSIRVHFNATKLCEIGQWLNRNSFVLMSAQMRSSYFCCRAFASARGLPWASVRGAARKALAILSSLGLGCRAKAAR